MVIEQNVMIRKIDDLVMFAVNDDCLSDFEFRRKKQTDEEIEQDMIEIKWLLYPKKIIIVSHYNAITNGNPIQHRNHLVQLLCSLCKKHHLLFINPAEVLSKYPQNKVLNDDLTHYTGFGSYLIRNCINHIVRKYNRT